jgi:hypothetical protein
MITTITITMMEMGTIITMDIITATGISMPMT